MQHVTEDGTLYEGKNCELKFSIIHFLIFTSTSTKQWILFCQTAGLQGFSRYILGIFLLLCLYFASTVLLPYLYFTSALPLLCFYLLTTQPIVFLTSTSLPRRFQHTFPLLFSLFLLSQFSREFTDW